VCRKIDQRFLWTLVLLSASVTYASGAFASTGAGADLSQIPAYFHDGTGQRLFTPSDTEFVVRVTPRPGRSGERPENLPPRVSPLTLPSAAAALEGQLEGRNIFIVRDAPKASIERAPGVEYVLPLLYLDGEEIPIYPTNRVAIQMRADADSKLLYELASTYGFEVEKRERGLNRYWLSVRDVSRVNPLALANYLHEKTGITEYAAPDFVLPKVMLEPDPILDPYYALQWHLDGDVLKGADANSDINAEAAWDSSYGATALGSPTVRVSILDECVEKWHPDLLPNWGAGLDLDNDPPDDDPSPDSGQRHGTACAGVAVAAANTIGVRGACPNCGLIGVKFFGATVAEMAEGFYFSMDPNNDGDHGDGAAVLSNSWTFAGGTLQPPEVVNAINTVAATGRNGKGVLILFAAGNNDHTINGVSAIAQLSSVLAVGGTNSHAQHTEFSDVGPEVGITTPTNDRGDDGVRFPWLDIVTVDNTGSSGYNGLPDLDYTNGFGGTSSATPLAAGILALIISQDETMTAAQARAILQHTAVRLDEPYGRFDPVTGHSHRFGYGRADAGQAIAAAAGGIRWPERINTLTASPGSNDILLVWTRPVSDYESTLVVKSDKPLAWAPTDGQTYALGEVVAPGVTVIFNGPETSYTDVGALTGAFVSAAYPRSPLNRYGFGAKAHRIRGGVTVLYDNCEGIPPAWTHDGPGDEWERGTPTSANGIFGQVVGGSGPLAGIRGVRAINGNNCWGTDRSATYNANANCYLQSPLLNLTGIPAPVFLEYWDWCLLETFYDRCTVEVVDVNEDFLGYVDADTGGDYDWTQRVYDITPFSGQPIKIRFRLQSDGLLQRDGWFLDEIRVTVAENVAVPPTAESLYAETPENQSVDIQLKGTDPNPGTILQFVITSLPAHGGLTDLNAATPITTVPYTLVGNGAFVTYTPATDYQGPDEFLYQSFDGALPSNDARVKLSVGTPVLVYDFPLDTAPGWVTEGLWAYGIPLGQGGDPPMAYTGTKIYGYNLAGKYEPNLPPVCLTTLPMNCRGLSRVTLSFARWLGVESASYDGASIEASIDGERWETVWRHSGIDLQQTSWSQLSYNIGAIADDEPFVQVRWVMGPTDGADEFSGWNLDDIRILGIGTPEANQPPLAKAASLDTGRNMPVEIILEAVDSNNDTLTYTVESLPTNGTLSDPNAGIITATPYTLVAPGTTVLYAPDPEYVGTDIFRFRVSDGFFESNLATVDITILDFADFPMEDTFEAGPPLASYWQTNSTSVGYIKVTDEDGPLGNFHVVMASGAESTYALNELTLVADLEGHAKVLLQYDWKDFDDERHTAPASWRGSAQGDAVAISEDGVYWHKIAELADPTLIPGGDDDGLRATYYQTVTLDLDAAAAAAGISYNRTFRIRFQQYDNNPIPSDGIGIDNVKLIQGTDDPVITTPALPVGILGLPYGPVSLTAAGGDHPLTWSAPLLYFEENLGASQFAEGGTPQNWIGDDSAFNYTLPFAFPFYGQNYTQVKVGTDGWINFGAYGGSTYNNSTSLLTYNKRIAVLWDDQTTEDGGDIYIDDATPGQVTFRWATFIGANPCNYSATLYDDGRIRMDYGPGNTPLTATIGVSAGDQTRYLLSAHDGQPNLGNASTMLMNFSQVPPGLAMDSAGTITGTPTRTGLFKTIFRVVDASQRTDEKLMTMAVVAPTFGDYDFDGDVDLTDYEAFADCMEAETASEMCLLVFDDDGDASVTLADFARFQREMAGEPEPLALLVGHSPGAGSTLWRPNNNVVRLQFDEDIVLPDVGQLQILKMIPGGGWGIDQTSNFALSVENDTFGDPRILRIFQHSPALEHGSWYAIRSTGNWPGVAPFAVEYAVAVGDADDDGSVLNGDLSCINAVVPMMDAGDSERRDIDGDGAVTIEDVDRAADFVPSGPTPRPEGH